MLRFVTAALFATLFLIPSSADAGPLSRFRARIQQRLAQSAPTPKQATPAPQAIPTPATPKVVGAADPQVVGAIGDGELRKRIFLRVLRGRIVDRAPEGRSALPGGGRGGHARKRSGWSIA